MPNHPLRVRSTVVAISRRRCDEFKVVVVISEALKPSGDQWKMLLDVIDSRVQYRHESDGCTITWMPAWVCELRVSPNVES